ncbi:MAG: hypothetical protein R2722_13235 [Tessaracoccus sp.]
MTVIVIAGGLSHERDVSIRSGRRVATALREQGLEVIETDLNTDLLPLIGRTPDPVVVPMLHGRLGRMGRCARMLDVLEVPFVGATGAASRMAFDKRSPLLWCASTAYGRAQAGGAAVGYLP